jgi:hypothetical protein
LKSLTPASDRKRRIAVSTVAKCRTFLLLLEIKTALPRLAIHPSGVSLNVQAPGEKALMALA